MSVQGFNNYEGTFIVRAKLPVGQNVITVGAISVVSDFNTLKTYSLTYDSYINPSDIVLNFGTYQYLTYYPKKLSIDEITELLK